MMDDYPNDLFNGTQPSDNGGTPQEEQQPVTVTEEFTAQQTSFETEDIPTEQIEQPTETIPPSAAESAQETQQPEYRPPYVGPEYRQPQQPQSGTYGYPNGAPQTPPYGMGQAPQYNGYHANPYDRQNNVNPYSAQQNPYPYRSAYPYMQNDAPYPYKNSTETQTPKKRGGAIFIAILALILVGVICLLGSAWLKTARKAVAQNGATQGNSGRVAEPIENVDKATTEASPKSEPLSGGAKVPSEIYQSILPSSVGILVYDNSSKNLSSEGSGVIFAEDNDGKYTYIITCAHVISGKSQSLVVQLYDEKEYTAEVVGYDLRTDIGVVRMEASGLKTLAIGDSASLSVGDTVYAIGNPGGTEFANTFTNGMVTALARPVASSTSGYTMECIQHNAAINPGNSGGALVNEYGQLIGINSMKIIASDYEGMGFAVPSSVFVDVVNSIIENGYVPNRPKIGISYLKATAEQAYAMFVAIKGLPGGSIIVASIAEDSDFYGKLKKGDLITAINGQDLNTTANIAAQIEEMNVGDKLTLHVVRINTDYSFEEFDFEGVLVEDKASDILNQEEDTTSDFEDYFGDYFDDYNNP